MTAKQRFQKRDGRRRCHYVQSFSEGDDLTPREVNAIGPELAQRVFPGYEDVIAARMDTNHLHNHLVVSGVNCENGRKLHQLAEAILSFMLKKANRSLPLKAAEAGFADSARFHSARRPLGSVRGAQEG